MSRLHRRPRLLLLGLAALAALVLACDEETIVDPPPPDEPGQLGGAVYQRLHPEVPLAGATVSWGGASAVSAADGSYLLAPAAAGADSLRVSLAGFVAESRWVVLGEEDQQQSFTLLPFDVTPPPAPLSLSVQSVDGQFLRLAWTAPADSADLAGYWLTKSPGDPQVQRFGIEVNEWLDHAIAPERDYTYTLASIDPSGNLSSALTLTTALDAPPQPSRLRFVPTGDYGHVSLRWSANPEDDFAAYRLYRAPDGSAADSLDLLVFSSFDPADTLFTDTGVVANAVYNYRLYTLDAVGQATSPLSLCLARGAAQRFAGLDGESRTLVFPAAPDRCLLVDADGGRVLAVDGAGTALDSLVLGGSPTSFVTLPDGRFWALAPQPGGQLRLQLLDSDPLALLSTVNVAGEPGDLTWLGGDSLVVAPFAGGAPVLYDAQSAAALDTLEALADLAPESYLAADPVAKQLFLAEQGGDRRLLRVDLAGPATLAETLSLPGFAVGLQRDGSGHLLLAFQSDNELRRFAETDFTQQAAISLPEFTSLGRFSSDGGEWWGRTLGMSTARGYTLDWSGPTATLIAAFGQLNAPDAVGRLEPNGAVVSLLDEYWVSFCDPSLGEAP